MTEEELAMRRVIERGKDLPDASSRCHSSVLKDTDHVGDKILERTRGLHISRMRRLPEPTMVGRDEAIVILAARSSAQE